MNSGQAPGFFEAIGICFRKYATFSGRAGRSEYWWFFLFQFLVSLALEVMVLPHLLTDMQIAKAGGTPPVTMAEMLIESMSFLFSLGTLLPSLAVTVRRLHDRDRSGWWWFLGLVPVAGPIVLLVWFCGRGTRGPNRFGPDPLGTL